MTDSDGREFIPLTVGETSRLFNLHMRFASLPEHHERWSLWRSSPNRAQYSASSVALPKRSLGHYSAGGSDGHGHAADTARADSQAAQRLPALRRPRRPGARYPGTYRTAGLAARRPALGS
jgi:hypothetical protein